MNEKTLGVDLGTNSIGLAIRNDNEFEWFGVYTFKKGVGSGKSGEFSLAAERTKHRSSRRLYNARRYRKWATLKILIKYGYCPLNEKDLEGWKKYKKGIGRVYPKENKVFNSWIKLDFDMDLKNDYTSPYQLRKRLVEEKVESKTSKYEIGRALYHIAQRRGFKSSRKHGKNEKSAVLKGSPETTAIGRNDYEHILDKHASLGAAFAYMESTGIRIRNRYTLRSDYEKEVILILEKQNCELSFREEVLKAIFYQRPLRSQKGLVGKCTMEPTKNRCQQSHPEFEKFRALSLINNIKYRKTIDEEWQILPSDIRKSLYSRVFMVKSPSFDFAKIRKHIAKVGNKSWELNYSKESDKNSVSSCVVTANLIDVFGEDWQKNVIAGKNKKGERRCYTMHDIWHLLSFVEDQEKIQEIFKRRLRLNMGQVDKMMKLWKNFPNGYGKLSLKALRKINLYLEKGLQYSLAVFYANVPEIIGEDVYLKNQIEIDSKLNSIIENTRQKKVYVNITNKLISDYYLLPYSHRFGWKDFTYALQQSDHDEVEGVTKSFFGKKTWLLKDIHEKSEICRNVTELYQSFFHDPLRKHLRQPTINTEIQEYLLSEFKDIDSSKIAKLYQPSMINIYPSKDDQIRLKSPKTGAFKNPMAYKTLHILRRVMNELLEQGRIDSDTRIVVEAARELNDSNRRKAIERWQRENENKNHKYSEVIRQLLADSEVCISADPESKIDKRKLGLWTEQLPYKDEFLDKIRVAKSQVSKYKLWKEQNCICLYTGKTISLTDLFSPNDVIDFEHTIPRSISFDNSMANLTVCYKTFNRQIKKNKLPAQLNNFNEIKDRIQPWIKKVEKLKYLVNQSRIRIKQASDKSVKDSIIQQMHLRRMELNYWSDKVRRFTDDEITEGFKNSQLIDTQIISKYAYHYLKTVFNKVQTQKGSVTAEFRQIFGITPKANIKDRSMHHHHAIDAGVLTMIPGSSEIRNILRKAYSYEEEYLQNYKQQPFEGFNMNEFERLKKEILIYNIPNVDQVLTPNIKNLRIKGKARKATGDSIRGEINKDTFYGVNRQVHTDPDGKPLRTESGAWDFKDGKDEYQVVLRIPLADVKVGKGLIVDRALEKHIEKQLNEGIKLVNCLDLAGNSIRHIRCRVKKKYSTLIPLKKHLNSTIDKPYKNHYYASSGENYAFGWYHNDLKDKLIGRSVYDASMFVKSKVREIADIFEPSIIVKGVSIPLFRIFTVGQKVIFYKDEPDELLDLDSEVLSKRMYYLKRLYDAETSRLQFQHHLDARSDNQLADDFPKETFGKSGINGFSSYQDDFIAPRLLLTPKKYKFILENKEFEMSYDGRIKFKFR